jgi:hypothetical protein
VVTNVNVDEFIAGENSARYAPPYTSSVISGNSLVSNNYAISNSPINILVDGHLNYFPMAQVVPLVDSLNYLGYTRKDIIDLQVTRDISLIAAGMGGINSGIMYWLNRINRELQVQCTRNLNFNAFDDDYWDITNVPRIPFHSLGVSPIGKTKSIWVRDVLRKNNSGIYLTANSSRIPVHKLSRYVTSVPPIVFGATDITTRGELSKSKDCVYLQITQSDHKLNIHINPEITMKTRDVYGTIFLNEFHMLTLKAALTLLEVAHRHSLNAIDTTKEVTEELFDIQEYDSKYGIKDWLGVVPKGVKYSRHNGYSHENVRPEEEEEEDND